MVTRVAGAENDTSVSRWNGLSSDAKPTKNIANGSSFYEMDTQYTYKFDADGNRWLLWSKGGGGGGEEPIASDSEVDEALDDLFEGHN